MAALRRAAEISPSDAGIRKSLSLARSGLDVLAGATTRRREGLRPWLSRLLGGRPEPVGDER